MSGTEWDVSAVTKVVDGDTLRLYRSRIMRLGDTDFRVTDVKPVLVRLVWVDTPERGQAGYQQARDDLYDWTVRAMDRIPGPRIVIYDGGAGWDRLLGDLIDADGNSASQWLMTEGNNGAGWPAYVKGK